MMSSKWAAHTTLLMVLFLCLFVACVSSNKTKETKTELANKNGSTTDSENSENMEDDLKTIESNRIRSYMDTSVDPCDDFYEYACGNFEKRSITHELKTKVKASLVKVLENNTNKAQTSSEQKVRKLFQSCINLIGDCEEKLSQVVKFTQTLGSWPLINKSKWSSVDFDWLDRVAKLRMYGIQSLLYESMQRNPRNPDELVITLGPEQIEDAITRKNLDEDSQSSSKKYFEKVTGKLMVSGVSRETAEEAADEILKFQKDRLDILKDWKIQYNNITEFQFDEFKKRFPDRNWNKFFETITGKPLSGSEKLLVLNESLLSDVIDNYDCIKPEILANYMLYKLMEKLESLEISNRDACVSDLQTTMGPALSSMYVREYFEKLTQENVLDMVNYVKWSVRQILKNAVWMDSTTKQEAKLKLSGITPLVGFYKEILDTSLVDDLYKNLEIDPHNFIKSAFSALQHKTLTQHNIHNMLNDQNVYSDVDLLSPNVELIPDRKLLVVPPVLQILPLFHYELPKSLNFGILGSLIGRELIHAFDTKGKCYDRFGNYRKWWTKNSESAYDQSTSCFVKFYGNYTFSSIHNAKIDGKKTLYENIADNGGMKLAYIAYNTWFNEHKDLQGVAEDEVLPGIDLNNKQLFFLGYANYYCEWRVYRELLVKEHQNYPHSPAKFRVLGSLANFKEFSKEFNCPLGSKMNPIEKCAIW